MWVKLQILVIHTIARDNHTSERLRSCAPDMLSKSTDVALVHKRLPGPGLERWLGLVTGQSRPGSNPTAENLASELWQFRLLRFSSVFRRRHSKPSVYARGSKRSHLSALECVGPNCRALHSNSIPPPPPPFGYYCIGGVDNFTWTSFVDCLHIIQWRLIAGVWQSPSVVGYRYRRRSWRRYRFGFLGFGFDPVKRAAACVLRGGMCVDKASCFQYSRFLCNSTFVCCPQNKGETHEASFSMLIGLTVPTVLKLNKMSPT